MKIHLRAETKLHEQRTPLTPLGAKTLIESGFTVTVESSTNRIFDDNDYQAAGCIITLPGSWTKTKPETYVLGLKELEEDNFPLTQKHIYFAHAYKEQLGFKELLTRFKKGNGTLYDLEYLTDDNNQRVCAFGYWAGYVGSALAIKAWLLKHNLNKTLEGPLPSYTNQQTLLNELQNLILNSSQKPHVMIIGALGRSGQGAIDLAKTLNLKTTEWDLNETKKGGPFKEILEHDIFVNCVFVQKQIPPFITRDMLVNNNKLSIISDVSCDPTSEINPIPIYDSITTMQKPVRRLTNGKPPIDLIAIDHLPSLLPKESSENFSEQLLPHLLNLQKGSDVWEKAKTIYLEHLNKLNNHP